MLIKMDVLTEMINVNLQHILLDLFYFHSIPFSTWLFRFTILALSKTNSSPLNDLHGFSELQHRTLKC